MSSFEDQLRELRQAQAEGHGKTRADEITFEEGGYIGRKKGSNQTVRREGSFEGKGKKRHDFVENPFPDMNHEDMPDSKKTRNEIINQKKAAEEEKRRKLDELEKDFLERKKINEERLLFLEKFFTRSGNLRKKDISVELADKNVQKDLDNFRKKRMESERLDTRAFLDERNKEIDRVAVIENEKNKKTKIKLLKREIVYIEKDILDLEKSGKDAGFLKEKLKTKRYSLATLTGKGFKTEHEKIDVKNNTNPSKTKTRHWPPEGFIQKPGVTQHWPRVVDNLNNFKPDRKSGNSVRPSLEQVELQSREDIKREIEKLNGEMALAVGRGDKSAVEKLDSKIFDLEQKLKSVPEKVSQDTGSSKKDSQSEIGGENVGPKDINISENQNLKTLAELGYSREDIKNIITGEELKRIHKEQIFKNPDSVGIPKAPTVLDVASVETLPNDTHEPETVIDFNNGEVKGKITILRDGAENTPEQAETINPNIEKINKIDEKIAKAKKVIDDLSKFPHTENIIKGQEEIIEKLQAEKTALEKGGDTNVANIENTQEDEISKIFELHKDRLVALGWDIVEFKKLTKEERDYVLWNGVFEKDYSRREKPEQPEKVEATLKETNEDQDLQKKIKDFATILVERKNRTGNFYFENQSEKDLFRENKQLVTQEIENLLPKKMPKDAEDYIKAENEKRAKEERELTARGVSEGAKEYIKGEKVLAEQEREKQKFAGALEKGYENFDKNKLIEIAKGRGLASGGDKIQIIGRLIEDDIKNNREDFGFANTEIKEKMREYNMTEKSMALLSPEFFALSPEKQRYLFSKIEQKIYLDANFASKERNEEEIKAMGFWKKAVTSFGKDQRQVGLRDKIIEEIKEKGLGEYQSDISTINSYLLDAPELSYVKNEKGRLVPQFEYVDASSPDKKYSTPKNFFNVAASRFGEIPYEWSSENATSAQRSAYQRAFESYTSSKEALFRATIEEAQKKNPNLTEEEIEKIRKDVVSQIAMVDAQVNFGSYITQNPEMEKMTSNFMERVLGTNVGDFARGKAFFAAGYATKWLGRSMAVTGVGIAVSAAVGGAMAYRKKNLEFNDKELKSRYGKEVNDLVVKKPVSFKKAHERLEGLVEQFEKEGKDEKSKQRILGTIKTRLFVTEEMVREKRVDFGSPKEATYNQYKLSSLVAKATVLVEMNGGFNEEKTEEEKVFDRFKQFVKDEAVQGKRNKEKAMAMLKGASIGAGAFALGAGVRWAQEEGYLGAAYKFISENASAGVDKIKSVAGNAWESVKESGLEGLDRLQGGISSAGGVAWDYWNSEGGAPEQILGEVKTGGFGPIPENLKPNYEVSEGVEVGKRGMIGGIDELQDKLRAKFTPEEMPEQYKEFMAKKPEDIAREWGAYRPDEENESAKVFKGAKFEIGKNGEVRFTDHLGATQKVFAPEVGTVKDFGGEFFGAGKQSITPSSILSEPVGQNNFDLNERVQERVAEGYDYTRNSLGGILTKEEVFTNNPLPPKEVLGYSNIDGLELDSKNIKGKVDFLYDRRGGIKSADLQALRVEDISVFRGDPGKFISGTAEEKISLGKKLLTVRSSVEKFLSYQRLLTIDTLHPDSAEYKFMMGESQKLFTQIQSAVDGKFNPVAGGNTGDSKIIGFINGKPNMPMEKNVPDFWGATESSPKINKPIVSSVSEGSDFVPKKEVPVPEAKSTTPEIETKNNLSPENIKLRKVSSGDIEMISSSGEEKTYSFKTDEVKGAVRFVLDKNGVIESVQTTPSTIVKGDGDVNSILKEGWQSSASKFSADTNVGLGKIRSGALIINKYEKILEAGDFPTGSPEYKYLTQEINFLKDKFKDVLK